MGAIRVRTRIDSDTLHLPQLRSLVGHTVEIIVVDQDAIGDGGAFWNAQTVDDLAKQQGVVGPTPLDQLYGDWSDEEFEGLEQAVRDWREADVPKRGR